MTRRVTERDIRMHEFRECSLKDLEFRKDGTVARKDRWERGIREIAGLVDLDPRKPFEVSDVVDAVRRMISTMIEHGLPYAAAADVPTKKGGR